MGKKLFGTDGVRGLANAELSPLLALQLGTTAAHVLVSRNSNSTDNRTSDPSRRRTRNRPTVLVGRDPRISGDILESAMISGICSQGVDALLVGVIPTPGVAYLTTRTGCAIGAVISASHNPVEDNGIKFFGPDGYKLDDAVETQIEEEIERFDTFPRPIGKDVGNIFRKHELVWDYAYHIKQTVRIPLDGINIVIDSANGAASELAPRVFYELGARATCVNCTPTGININESCGSLHPEQMATLVRQTGADAGLSFDGDADRVIMADEQGRIVDGDKIMAIYALHRAKTGGLPFNTVVGTVMSNIGLELALAREGIRLVRTPVGDRYVSDEMRSIGAVVGGEKSGHIILSDYTTTGDGMITALQILQIMITTGKRLSELAAQMEEFPQILVNVKVQKKDGWDTDPEIAAAIKNAEEKLSGKGRVVVRPSGTEKVIRIMVEGADEQELHSVAADLREIVLRRLGES
ncbi:MAG: phosphoglucosamine mutase [Armatimonadota bacterium]|nr:phosphoglucosamine mutase [Armatimonadota bacterium]